MSSNKRISVTIRPLDYADISSCAQITSSTFSTDPHTIVKQLGRKKFDMYAISRSGFLTTLHRKTYIYVKAIDDETGNIVGQAGWAFRGVNEGVIPWSGPTDEKPAAEEQEWYDGLGREGKGEEGKKTEEDLIDRLHALEDANIQHWLSVLIPPCTPCMFIIGLIVSPSHQSRGVGSALIHYGNAIADQVGLSTWVHSSDQAWKAYRKHGFQVEKELEVDLDEYAPRGASEGEEVMGDKGTGRWGRYIIRYMKRVPNDSISQSNEHCA